MRSFGTTQPLPKLILPTWQPHDKEDDEYEWFKSIFDAADRPDMRTEEANDDDKKTDDCLVVVKTADKCGADTNAEVSICLMGNVDKTSPILLHDCNNSFKAMGRKRFRRNQIDIFLVHGIKDIGHLEQIEIGHDETGPFPVWNLEWVAIYKSGHLSKFPVKAWIGKTSYWGTSSVFVKRQPHFAINCTGEILAVKHKKPINFEL